MLWLYRLLFLPVMLLASPYYLMRMRRRGGYRTGFGQRFGTVPELPAKRPGVRRIWLQAVSVGEMLAVGPLLEAWARDPAVEVYLTTTTSTGHALARERYGARVLAVAYFPMDWWPFAAKAWDRVRPDLIVFTEGERWPEHLAQANARGVPAVAVNARLSDRSFRRMRRAGPLAGLMVRGLTRVLAASEGDAERFRALGVPADRIEVTGNLKLDVTLPPLAEGEAAALRASLGFGDEPILLGASTWPGEEAALIDVFKQLRAAGWGGRLLIVPRHAERRGEIEPLLRACGLPWHLRSRGPAAGPADIAVADTTGELRKLLQLAEVVFVGKSLPPHTEGQTPVEAAALGRPVVFGPGMANFRVIARELVGCGAARIAADAAALAGEARKLLLSETERARMGEAAAAWHRANQGAAARTLEALKILSAGRDK